MSDRILCEYERALENVFFAQQDEALLQKMREADRTKSLKAALTRASGVSDDAVLDQLLALNMDQQTLAALAMVPVVLVAWADGMLDQKERDDIHDAARQAGISRSPEARSLLDRWLSAPPSRELKQAWQGYVRAMTAKLPTEARPLLKRQTLEPARRVAEAAGGFFGLGNKISYAEAVMLKTLERAFDGA